MSFELRQNGNYMGYIDRDFEVIPYFKAYELACQGTGNIQIDRALAIHLPLLRHTWGKPLNITSACRTPEHNEKVGGHPNSLHLTKNPKYSTTGCAAVDIATRRWTEEQKKDFCTLAAELGWNYGVANTFIHVDRGQDHGISPRSWTY